MLFLSKPFKHNFTVTTIIDQVISSGPFVTFDSAIYIIYVNKGNA